MCLPWTLGWIELGNIKMKCFRSCHHQCSKKSLVVYQVITMPMKQDIIYQTLSSLFLVFVRLNVHEYFIGLHTLECTSAQAILFTLLRISFWGFHFRYKMVWGSNLWFSRNLHACPNSLDRAWINSFFSASDWGAESPPSYIFLELFSVAVVLAHPHLQYFLLN